jgi:hypothetical protein
MKYSSKNLQYHGTFRRPGRRVEDNIEMNRSEIVYGTGLNEMTRGSSDGLSEHSDETSGSLKSLNILTS